MKFRKGQNVYDKHFKRYGKIADIIKFPEDPNFLETPTNYPFIVLFKRLNRDARFVKRYNCNGDCLHLEKKKTLIIPLIEPVNRLLKL